MSPDRLFTPHFFVMCGFTFTVFLSAFQLLPTAPFHILDLGGSTFASGLFLGFLTYSSAFSAPLTGALADRLGQRRILIVSSLALAAFSIGYALIPDYRITLALVVLHGVFWSGLLSASASYMTNLLPEGRRAEGIGYWGLSTVAAMAVAPTMGLWIYRHGGWLWLCIVGAILNLVMAGIAWNLRGKAASQPTAPAKSTGRGQLLEWRVLIISFSLFLYSFGYGGITSFTALYADSNGVTRDRHPLHAAARRADGRPLRLQARVHTVLGAHQPRAWTVGRRRDARLADRVRGRLRRRVWNGVSGICRLRDAGRRCRSPRRCLRRDSRGVRHLHRHRLDVDGLPDSALRLCDGVRHRGGALGSGLAVLPYG
jgi:hypothetical protein